MKREDGKVVLYFNVRNCPAHNRHAGKRMVYDIILRIASKHGFVLDRNDRVGKDNQDNRNLAAIDISPRLDRNPYVKYLGYKKTYLGPQQNEEAFMENLREYFEDIPSQVCEYFLVPSNKIDEAENFERAICAFINNFGVAFRTVECTC